MNCIVFLSTERGFRPEQWVWGDEYENVASIHYVAGREFETAEEANEWLSYVVLEREENVNEPTGFGRTPLHCACKWGNFYGVNWLLSHSATVDVEDDFGWTPYLWASTSSLDALKKMKVLEERASDVPSHAIRFAVQNQFSSFDKAHEVLRHLVFEKGMSIDSQDGELRVEMSAPLYDAFRGGNIFGVKWLIDNGANIDVVIQQGGEDLYEDVCKSAVDTLKKLRILENNGCEVSPRAIVLASGVRFDSSKEACDLFHHLVHEKGVIVNSLDELLNTPLHCACEHGSLSEVQWLVENSAAIDSVNKEGSTPLMMACESGIDRLLKVRYLTNKGADCQVKDMLGRTALFYAVRYTVADNFNDPPYVPSESSLANECSISEGELKDVLQYLVEDKRMEIDSSDAAGLTPLLHACLSVCYPLFALRPLIELKADVAAKDSMGRNALHLVALADERDFQSVIEFLIDKGADVTSEDKDGKKPYQLADNGEIRRLLHQHYDTVRFSVLRRETVQPDSIKFCVVGSEMAGKTTFVNALLQLDLPPVKLEDRTAGIFIKNGQIPGVGKGVIWDFGAQSSFHSAHGLFFGRSNTMFVLVLRFREGQRITPEVYLLEIGRYWCAFVKAAMRVPPPHLRSLLRLVIIGNVIECREVVGIEASFQLKRVAEVLQEEFKDTFSIVDVLEMDCSRSYSVPMSDCRDKLKILRENMLEAADGVPKLCYAIEEKLTPSDRERESSSLPCFMTLAEFEEWVAKDVGVIVTEDERKVSVEFLDSSGIIVNLGPLICLQPMWLCRDGIGPLMAPHYFPFGMKPTKSGMVTIRDIESALRAFNNYLKQKGTPSPFSVSAKEAISILLYLELCIEVKHGLIVYQFPALLQDSVPDDAWIDDPILDVYRGMRYECADSVDIILPLSFVVFQSRCSHMNMTRHEAWKDGVKLVKIVDDKQVECLVTLGTKKEHCCIDVVLRWSSQNACHVLAQEFLNELKEMIVAVCEERSAGVLRNWFYLGSACLKRLDDNPAIYSSSKVDEKIRNKKMTHFLFSDRPKSRCYSSSVRDLAIPGVIEEERNVSQTEPVMLSCQGPSGTKRILIPTELAFSPAKRAATSHDRLAVENPAAEIPDPVRFLCPLKGAFPRDSMSVSIELIRTCAVVAPSKWEDIGHLLIDSNTVDEIGERTRTNLSRMVKVLESWKLGAKAPTVGELLKWFELIGITRGVIETKYLELH
ncbi:death-associated protein kinase 1-like isoform X3 [Oscarella lobularis]|uniref:death-associated protein kinase 1-like isoform X3 n=1 Tax=Oscarella lobularis TaxID=121494 RepID=UPI00331367A4